jgi:DNA-binding NarL/FixJ family response regulator
MPPIADVVELTGSVLAALPDVVLLDINLGPAGSGLDLVEPLVAADAKVLVVSSTTDEAVIGACLERGATGWLSKDVNFDVLLHNALAVARGEKVLPDDERQRLIDTARRRRRELAQRHAPFAKLSRREAEVLGDLMLGHNVERIAEKSFVSVATVRTQVRSILLKLEVKSQLEAVALAASSGWSVDVHRPPA